MATAKSAIPLLPYVPSIRVYDIERQREVGVLCEHVGSITCLDFYGRDCLLSGSSDGSIIVWNCATWDCLKVLRGHTAAVLDLSVHPSGRLALSIGADKTVYAWNLLKGRSLYKKGLKSYPSLVKWFRNGNAYAIASRQLIDLYDVETGAVFQTLTLPAPVLAVDFFAGGAAAVVGAADSTVRVFDTATGHCGHEIRDAHENRVRHVAHTTGPDGHAFIVTASSDGHVKVWKLPQRSTEPSHQNGDAFVGSLRTGDRLTCMVVQNLADEVAQAEARRAAKDKEKKQRKKQSKARATRRKGERGSDRDSAKEKAEANESGSLKPAQPSQTSDRTKKKPAEKKKAQQPAFDEVAALEGEAQAVVPVYFSDSSSDEDERDDSDDEEPVVVEARSHKRQRHKGKTI